MKNLILYTVISAMLTSCAASYNEIGSLGMLSDRHLDPNGHYQKLAANVGSEKKVIVKTKADNIEAAINQVLNQIPGAQYMTNVKIYAVDGDYLAVSGDVWGYQGVDLVSSKNGEKVASIAKK